MLALEEHDVLSGFREIDCEGDATLSRADDDQIRLFDWHDVLLSPLGRRAGVAPLAKLPRLIPQRPPATRVAKRLPQSNRPAGCVQCKSKAASSKSPQTVRTGRSSARRPGRIRAG